VGVNDAFMRCPPYRRKRTLPIFRLLSRRFGVQIGAIGESAGPDTLVRRQSISVFLVVPEILDLL